MVNDPNKIFWIRLHFVLSQLHQQGIHLDLTPTLREWKRQPASFLLQLRSHQFRTLLPASDSRTRATPWACTQGQRARLPEMLARPR